MQKKILILILVDQITKLIFTPLEVSHLKLLTGFSHRDFFVGILHIHLVKNTGLAFSMNFGLVPNLILLFLGVVFFVYYYRKHDLAFILVLAGAVSNIIDRLYLSYVRDFLDLSLGFTFNLADVFLVSGLILIIVSQPKSKLPAYR